MLVNRLMNHVLGGNKMTASQVRAAEICLRKTLPDLQAIEQHGTGEAINRVISAKPMSVEE